MWVQLMAFSMFIMFLAWPVVCEIAAGYMGSRLGLVDDLELRDTHTMAGKEIVFLATIQG